MLIMACFGIKLCLAQSLVIHHSNGTSTEVDLYNMPKVHFEDDKVLITSTVLDMEYPKDEVLGFTYKGGSTGIGNVTVKRGYNVEDDKIVFHGIKTTDRIAVYSVNGIRIPARITIENSTATLPLSSIPSGVYLLNVNGITSKFIKP